VLKKSTVFHSVVLISTLGISMSCSQSVKKGSLKTTTIAAAQLANEGKVNEAAEMYSRIGEILLSRPEGITHAQEMFKKAIELNPNDNKANLYSALISPILSAQGFGTRFKKIYPNVEKLEKSLVDSGIQEIIDFALVMPAGKTVAKKAEDVRKYYLDELAKEIGNSLVKLDNIKSDKFSIELNLSSYKTNKNSETYCRLLENGDYDCETFEFALKGKSVKRNIDSYDIKAIKSILKTQKNALTVAYSFSLEGAEEVSAIFDKSKSKMTDKEVVSALNTQPNFLKIQGSKDDLRQIFSHTEDVLNDLIDFSKISKEICHNEERKDDVAANLCVSEAAADKANEILMFVVGPKSITLGHNINGEEVTVEINLRGLLDSKVSSLQELLPSKFDSQGKAIDFKDLTFAGLIPNADLITKLKTVVK
jgi:tetratricopeptide (TPR) repeat protein